MNESFVIMSFWVYRNMPLSPDTYVLLQLERR
jgi:hypothetical protein